MVDESNQYRQLLEALALIRPRVARRLHEAEQRRSERLRTYLDGRRLQGLEQLHAYLEALEDAYRSDAGLEALAFLVARARRDFETALEATLSAYQGVAADAMRDVMEIEYLLYDFALHDDHANEWLSCARSTRLSKYSPAKLRARLKAAGLPPFASEGWEPLDYRAHSESLHVTPTEPLLGGRGMEGHPDSLLADAGFIEMFEHASRFLVAAEMLRHVRAGRLPEQADRLAPLDAFQDAKDRTDEMLVIVLAMLTGPTTLAERLGRPPTSVEVLKHVRGELLTNSPRRFR